MPELWHQELWSGERFSVKSGKMFFFSVNNENIFYTIYYYGESSVLSKYTSKTIYTKYFKNIQ